MIWFLSAVKSILTIFREMFLGISSNCSYMTITALPVFRSNIFSWNNFISPFSQGYFQQSKLPSSFTAWKFMWCWMPSWVCWIQNKLLESNDFPHAPILWFLVTKSPDYDIGAEKVKKEECRQNVLKGNENFAGHSYMSFFIFSLSSSLSKKRPWWWWLQWWWWQWIWRWKCGEAKCLEGKWELCRSLINPGYADTRHWETTAIKDNGITGPQSGNDIQYQRIEEKKNWCRE